MIDFWGRLSSSQHAHFETRVRCRAPTTILISGVLTLLDAISLIVSATSGGNVHRGIRDGNTENAWLCETPMMTHLITSAPGKNRMSRKDEHPSKTRRNSNSVLPRPPLTRAKRVTLLQPTWKNAVSRTIVAIESFRSAVMRLLAARTISSGVMQYVSGASTVSNVCRKRILESSTTKSVRTSSFRRSWILISRVVAFWNWNSIENEDGEGLRTL